jgi:single-strand DNA-binding protein
MGSAICIIMGNVGRDPEIRYTQDGKAVCNFSVAVNRGKDDPVIWFRVSAWERLAEVCNEYVTKGMVVQVTGSPRASAYIDQAGQARASLEISARDVQFGSRVEAGDEPEPAPERSYDPGDAGGSGDVNDIPF